MDIYRQFYLAMSKKLPVAKTVKILVWNAWVGEENGVGTCTCCGREEIKQLHFEAGHYISEANKGSRNPENLRPVCSACNKSMGSKNMEDFAKHTGLSLNWPRKVLPTPSEYRKIINAAYGATVPAAEEEPGDSSVDGESSNQETKEGVPNVDVHEEKKLKATGEVSRHIEEKIAALTVSEPKNLLIEQVTGDVLMSVLSTTEMYEHNRVVDKKNVARIVDAATREKTSTGLVDFRNNMICIGLAPASSAKPGAALVRVLLDGNHRMEALKLLGDHKNILAVLWVKRCRTQQQFEDEFLKINCGTPVPSAYYSGKVAAIVNGLVDKIGHNYPDFEMWGSTAQRPKFRRTDISDTLTALKEFTNAVLDKDISPENLYDAFLEVNEEYKAKFDKLPPEEKKRPRADKNHPSGRMYEKMELHGFYVGMHDGTTWARTVANNALAARTARKQG